MLEYSNHNLLEVACSATYDSYYIILFVAGLVATNTVEFSGSLAVLNNLFTYVVLAGVLVLVGAILMELDGRRNNDRNINGGGSNE